MPGLCAELSSLSWLSATPGGALNGIRKLVTEPLLTIWLLLAKKYRNHWQLPH